MEVIFTPLLVAGFGLLYTFRDLSTDWRSRRTRRRQLSIAQRLAERFGLRVVPTRRYVYLLGSIAGRPVQLWVFERHCRASARFTERLLPRQTSIVFEGEPTGGRVVIRGQPSPRLHQAFAEGHVPCWLRSALRYRGHPRLTVRSDDVLVVGCGDPITFGTCLAALERVVEQASIIERSRPQVRLR